MATDTDKDTTQERATASGGAAKAAYEEFTRGAQHAAGQINEGVEATITRIRELNERVINAAKNAGQANLDAYERALRSFLEVEQRLAGASQLDWVQGVVRAQSDFVQSLSEVYVNAAREALR